VADLVFPNTNVSGVLNADAMPSNVDLRIYKGDYVEIYATFTDTAGAINLTGYTAQASLKSTYADTVSVADFTCTLTGTTGQVRIYMPSSVSATIAPGSYIWDFQLVNGSFDARTYMTGDVIVYNEVTITS
jgi:hypothetical protein